MHKSFTLVYIFGSGHNGSTLLDMLLNGHSQVTGLGEIININRYIAQLHQSQDNPQRVEFWKTVGTCYEAVSGQSFTDLTLRDRCELAEYSLRWVIMAMIHPTLVTGCERYLAGTVGIRFKQWTMADIATWAEKNRHLFSCIARISGTTLLTDTSKSWERLYLLQQSRCFSLKVIHLVRDGRAVVNSYVRKYSDYQAGIRRWLTPSEMAFYLRVKHEPSAWLQVKYEDLALDPESTLKKVCAFLDIPFEPSMLCYRNQIYVATSGNRMRHRQDEHIILDETWKQDLSRLHRIKFALRWGWLNKLYGY